MLTSDEKRAGPEPAKPSVEHENVDGREADQTAIPTDKRQMTLMERIVYVKTWSKSYRNFILWLPDWITPNKVSFFRTALIVPIVLALRSGAYWTALALFAFATALDSVDGAIAHNKRMGSTAGEFYDPLGDKVLICGVLFAVLDAVPSWIGAVAYFTLAGAIALTAIRIWKLTAKTVRFLRSTPEGFSLNGFWRQIVEAHEFNRTTKVSGIAAKPAGKMKMIFDVVATILIIAGQGLAVAPLVLIGGGLLVIAFGFACASFFSQLAE